jgi:hypothetical protein
MVSTARISFSKHHKLNHPTHQENLTMNESPSLLILLVCQNNGSQEEIGSGFPGESNQSGEKDLECLTARILQQNLARTLYEEYHKHKVLCMELLVIFRVGPYY